MDYLTIMYVPKYKKQQNKSELLINLQNKEREISSLKEQLKQCNDEKLKFRAQIGIDNKLNQSIQVYQNQLEQKNKELQELRKILERKQKQINENDENQEYYETIIKENSEITKERNDIKVQNDVLRNDIKDLTVKLDDCNEKLNKRLSRLRPNLKNGNKLKRLDVDTEFRQEIFPNQN